MGGLHFWWPKISGRLYPEGWAKFSALLVFAGFNLTFFPQFILGYLGQAAPLSRVRAGVPGAQRDVDGGRFDPGHGSYLIPLIYFIWSLRYGPKRGQQSMGRKGLEWETTSPPPTFNFDKTPIVTEEAYAYSPQAGGGSHVG